MLSRLVRSAAVILGCCLPALAAAAADPASPPLDWIWGHEPAAGAAPAKLVFERKFSLPRVPVSARARLAAPAGVDVIVNGTRVNGTAAKAGKPAPPLAFDVPLKQLAAGDNTIRIEVTPQAAAADAIVFSLLTADADGTRRRVGTDASWTVAAGDAAPRPAVVVEPYGAGPRGDVLATLAPTVSPAAEITVPPGFKVERLHALDDHEGSWVALCSDPQGRLIASDAGGGLVRITPPPIGGDPAATRLEPIALDIGHANGLLWAFDSLYVMVCEEGVHGHGSGVYRVRDTDGDDRLDSVEFLRKIHGGGDHGPHALVLSPDGASITVVCGNATRMTEIRHHRVPPVWKDDLALPKLTGHGFMLGAGGPAGYFARMSPDGSEWTLFAAGFRNQYDAAYNRHGELFTYDADMEWDIGMPWYRPTRVNHVVDGTEAGWRSVSGKWPEYYADSLPPVINVGRGSPTGVAFGYGTRFPAKWQEALFIADWTYGKLYAVHLRESGASYKASQEVFLEGRGVKPTDIAVGPRDGALYFCGGSRRSNSGLYRVTYVGPESTAEPPPAGDAAAAALRGLRHRLEAAFPAGDEASLALALENLSHDDRFIRFAARTLLELRPVEAWETRALADPRPRAAIQTALALARLERRDRRDEIYRRLAGLDFAALDAETRLDALRALEVAAARLGDPEGDLRARLLAAILKGIPAADERCNIETAQLLVRWESPLAARTILPLFERAGSQEDQIAYAAALRLVREGWPAGGRERYFKWFLQEKFHTAGHLQKFIADIRKDAVASLSDAEKASLQAILDARPEATIEPPLASRLFVRTWTTADLAAEVEPLLAAPRDLDRGKRLYRETGCLACHLFKGEGGVTGPDLSLAANKFSNRELLEHVAEPSRVISDQYATTLVVLDDGTSVTGRLVGSDAEKVQLQPNLYAPADVRVFKRSEIDELTTSPVSLMPLGLLNTCHPPEVADLLAFIQSGLEGRAAGGAAPAAAAPAAAAITPADNVAPPGFVALFNGRDLAGWTENGKPPAHWSVQDGELRYDGQGTHLFTTDEFGDFVMLVDWNVPPRGNSGVLLRGGGTQVEINDADPPTGPLWNGTSGGLYPDRPPTKRAAKPAGAWNRFEIRVEKGVITVLTNGDKTVDAFAKDWGNRPRGPIGFQHHGTPLAFKNIFVKRLDGPAAAP
jgi:putative heme-binding domain-containing protein